MPNPSAVAANDYDLGEAYVMKRREIFGICFVVLVGLFAAATIVLSERRPSASVDGHDHGSHEHEGHSHAGHSCGSGPHGGKILTEGDLTVELAIHENGSAPHFRAYCSEKGKPIDPRDITVAVEITRLGERVSEFHLVPDKEFLFSSEEVEHPHSFEVKVTAHHKGESVEWEYWQIQERLEFSPTIRSKMGIETDEAGPRTITSLLRLPGEVAFNADKVYHIVPRVAGVVLDACKELGHPVKKGETIAVIDSRELAEARSKYLVAFEREKLARYNFERAERLWEKQTIAEKEFLTAQKAFLEEKIELSSSARKLMAMGATEEEIASLPSQPMSELTRYEIRAASDGVVVQKHLAPGEWVKEDAEIYMIADLSDVWVEVTVYAADLKRVRVGQKATVSSDLAGLRESGEVSYVGPVVGEDSRTAKARIVIPNPDGTWKPGLFVQVALTDGEITVPVAVKKDALQTHKDQPVVFVNFGDEFEPRPIRTGRTDGRHVEVVKGLAPGESYVCSNSFLLKAELGKQGISHQH